MKRLDYIGIKEENKPFRLENGHDFRIQLNLLPPGRFFLTIQKEYKKATPKQFGWLFGGIYPQFMEALNNEGYEFTTIEEVDLFAKSMWANKPALDMSTGEIRNIPMSKAEFLTIDHKIFVENIRYYAAEYLSAKIDDPDVNWKEHKAEVEKLHEKNINKRLIL